MSLEAQPAMFNPSELEGEVDHSFFDSDCEESKDGGGKTRKNSKAKGNQPAPENVQTQQTESAVDGTSRGPGQFLNLLAGEEGGNEDQSSVDTEGETSVAKDSSSKPKNVRSKRLARRRRPRTVSSAEASTDSESEGSCSAVSGRSSVASSTRSRPGNPSSTEGRRSGMGLAASQNLRSLPTDSESTVTDVTPLSRDSSYLHSVDLNRTEADDGTVKESLPSRNEARDDYSKQDAEYSLASDSRLDRMVFYRPGGRRWRNYSFTKDEVRRIDQENQRLCSQLSLLSQGPRSGSVLGQYYQRTINSPVVRLSHSGLNRQREQQRINRENLAFVKRVESVKPTPGLTRSEQLADYQRQVGYLRGPSYPIFKSTTKKGRLTSRASSGMGVRQSSAAHHSPAAASSSSQDPGDARVKDN